LRPSVASKRNPFKEFSMRGYIAHLLHVASVLLAMLALLLERMYR